MMESNPSEAFLNNVIGTLTLLDTAIEYGSERFVMISSDKAVSPSSVMGATKRLGEMLLQQKAVRSRDTRLASVRFGNVVGSRGSVIPIFLKQIAEGKPLTLTDERMSRYFMTVKEAVQLVLQASTLASDGEIYTLDMGDPVMIATLARKLIEMSGLRPEKDVPIKIIGIRPGEKLQEELWCEDSEVSATEFPRVLRVDTPEKPADLDADILELEELAVARRNGELREKLRILPKGHKKQDKLAASAGD
jgi:FlaA1/EpsC-like NDP-sugar epimerase